MSDVKYELYKKTTDEFHLLYNAFSESGFTKDEAFELIKCYCTSANLQGMMEKIIQGEKHRNRSDMIRYMGKLKKGEEDDKDKTDNG